MLSLVDRGCGAGTLSTRGGGVDRSSFCGGSHSASGGPRSPTGGSARFTDGKKPLLEFQNLVLGELIRASGILDAVPAVQWILCLVAGDMPLVGRLIVGAGTEHLGHISRNFHILILDVTAAKAVQTDNRHGNRQLCVWYSRLR